MPPGAAGAGAGEGGDLSGYTGMLPAATQAQAQLIEALKGQIESLSRTVERLSHRAAHRGTSVRP